MTTEKAESIALDIPGGTIRGLRYGHGRQNKMLCLHGWLDNASSFLPLMPYIDNTEIVALDLPGHGLSDHQPDSFPYTIATNAHKVLQVAEALDWQEFHLTGHSLGGCIAPFCSIAAPEKIKSLVMIDAVGPISESAEQLPARFKRHHEEFNDPDKYRGRTYQTVDEAIQVRLMANKMYPESAKLIVERQLMECEDGFKWRFDRKLRLASPAYYTENQVHSILQALQCPVLCVLAVGGHVQTSEKTAARLELIQNKTIRELPGHHHLHMDTPMPVASEINQFLAS